eukprot:COSAG05_NODE_11289_length_521_cov_0.495261_1_plen_40_part_10
MAAASCRYTLLEQALLRGMDFLAVRSLEQLVRLTTCCIAE